jgi:hypothetical protein
MIQNHSGSVGIVFVILNARNVSNGRVLDTTYFTFRKRFQATFVYISIIPIDMNNGLS